MAKSSGGTRGMKTSASSSNANILQQSATISEASAVGFVSSDKLSYYKDVFRNVYNEYKVPETEGKGKEFNADLERFKNYVDKHLDPSYKPTRPHTSLQEMITEKLRFTQEQKILM